jgi:hypothetical protein
MDGDPLTHKSWPKLFKTLFAGTKLRSWGLIEKCEHNNGFLYLKPPSWEELREFAIFVWPELYNETIKDKVI